MNDHNCSPWVFPAICLFLVASGLLGWAMKKPRPITPYTTTPVTQSK